MQRFPDHSILEFAIFDIFYVHYKFVLKGRFLAARYASRSGKNVVREKLSGQRSKGKQPMIPSACWQLGGYLKTISRPDDVTKEFPYPSRLPPYFLLARCSIQRAA